MTEILKDSAGNASSMRIAMIFVIVLTMIIWAIVSFKNGVLVDIPENILWLNMAAISGKAGQKFLEKA